MSRNQFNTSNALKPCSQTAKFLNKAPVKKPYCKVCHDAGKPEKDYTSHYVKSLKGDILCPTLLNTECRFCRGIGHTTKFCPTLANKKKTEERENRRENMKPLEVKPKQENRSGGFSALLDLDEDEEPLSKEWPALGEPSQRVESVAGYAAAVAKQVPMKASVAVKPTTGFQVLQKGAVYTKTTEPEKPRYVPTRMACWAEYDSDYEEEEDLHYNEIVAEYNDAWD